MQCGLGATQCSPIRSEGLSVERTTPPFLSPHMPRGPPQMALVSRSQVIRLNRTGASSLLKPVHPGLLPSSGSLPRPQCLGRSFLPHATWAPGRRSQEGEYAESQPKPTASIFLCSCVFAPLPICLPPSPLQEPRLPRALLLATLRSALKLPTTSDTSTALSTLGCPHPECLPAPVPSRPAHPQPQPCCVLLLSCPAQRVL